MKKFTSGLFCISLLVIACSHPDSFRIEGSFTVKDPTPMKLYLLDETGSVLIDSQKVITENFSLEGPITDPGIYQLRFFNDQSIYLALFPGDRMKLTIDNKFPSLSYYVENSFESKRIKELMDSQEKTLREIDQLSREWEIHHTDTVKRRRIDSTYLVIMRDQKEFTREFIHRHPGSLANVMAIYQNFGRKSQPLFDPYDDFDLFRFVDSNLVAAYPSSAPVLALNKEVNAIKDDIEQKKYIKKVVETGRPLPSLKFPDIYGDTLSIPENPGVPVLLIFWSSWNPFSVKEILSLNEFYTQRISSKLMVLSISLDTRPNELMQFVKDHQLKLPVICDYKYWDSELVGRYAVKQIPSTFLASKEGLIIARDLFGEEMYNQINESIK